MPSSKDHVLDHYENPRHQSSTGSIDCDDGLNFGKAETDICHDSVNMWAWIKDGVIINIWWDGQGCCFSQAAASMLAEYALGKTVAEMKAFAPHELFDLFQADCPMAREGCVLVSLQALHNLLETL